MDDFAQKQYAKWVRDGKHDVVYWGVGKISRGIVFETLKKCGVVPLCFCDSNEKLWDKEVASGIYCRDYHKLEIDNDKTVWVILVKDSVVQQKIMEQIQRIGGKHIIAYQDLLKSLEYTRLYFEFIGQEHIAVYTCVVDDYDVVEEPSFDSDSYDFYLVSDKPPRQDSKFKWLNIREIVPEDIDDYTKMNRYCKINAHLLFPRYRRSIYFDGNFAVLKPLDEFFDKLKKTGVGVYSRHTRKGLYEEAVAVIELGKDKEDVVRRQIKKYWQCGMPKEFGLAACGLLLRNHNNPNCINIMHAWWNEVKTYSKRDQISFLYAVWSNGFSVEDIFFISNHFESEYWEIRPHKAVENCCR